MGKANPFRGEPEQKEGQMLDAFIIEELKRRERLEEERRQDAERPFLEIPVPPLPEDVMPYPVESESDEGKPERGVIVIDFSI